MTFCDQSHDSYHVCQTFKQTKKITLQTGVKVCVYYVNLENGNVLHHLVTHVIYIIGDIKNSAGLNFKKYS
jgi:hypothetical protein